MRLGDPPQCCLDLLKFFRQTGFPLRLIEPGAGAGLNLRWDHYFYQAQDEAWGNPDSPVVLRGSYRHGHPSLNGEAPVIERIGCDEKPLHAASEEDRLTLLSYVWPDQKERVERTRAAIDLARRIPVAIDAARAEEWIERQLKLPAKQRTTVVFHSIFFTYLSKQSTGHEIPQRNQAIAGRLATCAIGLRFHASGFHAQPGQRSVTRCSLTRLFHQKIEPGFGLFGQVREENAMKDHRRALFSR